MHDNTSVFMTQKYTQICYNPHAMTKMNGQRIGKYTGTTSGAIHINIDEEESNYRGVAYMWSDDQQLPPVIIELSTVDKEPSFAVRTDSIQAIDRETAKPVSWESVASKYPAGMTFSKYADVRGEWSEEFLNLSWTSDNGLIGECVLPRSRSAKPSDLVALEQNWSTFREYVIQLAAKRPLFRGQKKLWRLRTPFHRRGRAGLQKFVSRDLPNLQQSLSAKTKHLFNLDNQLEFGAFLNLVQHHGYPTPILDWTYSPYVAAFFAYRGITNAEAAESPIDAKIRVFVFDAAEWMKTLQAITFLIHPQLHLTVREFMPLENNRMLPQQAVSTVASVDDIETHIQKMESIYSKKFLRAIDLPVRDRKQAMRELSYMGITAGSLFPGLDGTCEELAERNFEF
jgi:hypothetical protein